MADWTMSIKEDPLPLVRLTSFIDLFPTYSTHVRIVSLKLFSLIFLAHMFGIYMQYFHEHRQDMNVLNSLTCYLGIIYLLYYSQKMSQMKRSWVLLQDSCKSLKSEGPKTYECILRKFQWLKWMHTLTFILVVAGVYVCTFPKIGSKISTLAVIVELSGKWSHVIRVLLLFIHSLTILGGQSVIALNTYMSFNIGAQFSLLQKFLKRTLHVKCDIYNKRQQEEIHKSLMEIVERYKMISGITNHFMNHMTSTIVIGFVPAVIGFASLTYILISENANYFCLTLPLAWLAAALCIPLAGQVVSDESSKIYDVMYDCPWYNWDSKNRKTLLFILTNIKEPITLHFMKLLALDYSFMIKFYRMSYALMTFIMNMKN